TSSFFALKYQEPIALNLFSPQKYCLIQYCCYISYSQTLDRYYVGETADIDSRINKHNSGFYKRAYTTATQDWELKSQLVAVHGLKTASCI
ncbi:MAG: GIY-YIG nuclease family protein, partial [Marinoscillum sp.]